MALTMLSGACTSSRSGAGSDTTSVPRSEVAGSGSTAETRPPETSTSTESAEPAGPHAFTTTTMTVVDPTRRTVARAPFPGSDTRTLPTSIRIPVGAGPWPLVVFGHGFAVSPETYPGLLDGLARAGFVVAAPDFPGSSSALPGRPDERDLQDEPCDLLLVADRVQAAAAAADGPLAGRVRPGPVALAGQSDGATAAAFAALTSTCAGPPVGAVIAFSAKPAPPRAGLDPATRPALLAVTGSADQVNPPGNTRALFDEFPARAWLLTLSGEGHLEPSTTSPHLDAVVAVAVDVLRSALADDPAAARRVAADAAGPGLTLEAHG